MALFGKKKKAEPEDAAAIEPEMTPAPEAETSEPTVEKAPKLKVRADIYTLLLGLSVAALVIASVILYVNIAEYGSSPLSGIKG